ncbi:glycosyltransferase [Streptomyces sp. NPDC052109]|uniref:glycosyltransferase n=1 Tax=Streptomyces sp. NPDC052109 TaxID=3155527 RepID=UPI0034122374
MRILVTTSPGHGHTFATVPLTWAFRAAGHEVLFATAGRLPADLPAVVGAGLHVAEIASRERMEALREQLRARTRAEADRLGLSPAQMAGRQIEECRRAREVRDGNGWAFAARIFGPMSAGTLDGLVEVGLRWQPDLVVFESMQGGGPLVAALLGVPAVEHPIGFARGPQVVDALAAYLAGDYARYGVRPPRRSTALDVSPPSMGIGPAYGRPMRYVPFNGGGLVGDWLAPRTGRPRIAVTLGTVLPEQGPGGFAPVIETAARLDAEFLLTAEHARLAEYGPLPDNVRGCGYVPLRVLLESCDALVHHGGSSTTLTALDAGVPQLVLPHMSDHFINAEAVRRRGCGVVVEDTTAVADALGATLGDLALGAAAREVRAEMAALPAPAQVADELVRWALTDRPDTAQQTAPFPPASAQQGART